MKDYVRISLETHLFFARIMKEHALFLQAGFVPKNIEWIRKADFFRGQFEDLLRMTVRMSNRIVSKGVLDSGELVTRYTMDAERKTSELSGIPIDRRITATQMELECACDYEVTQEEIQVIDRLNEKAVWMLKGFIDFKEKLLKEVKTCCMYTTNYPLFIEHNMEEARLYCDIVQSMMNSHKACYIGLPHPEEFWNCIMMEHALFIRGMLDPCEAKLIGTANEFVHDFGELLEMAGKQEACDDNACMSDKEIMHDCKEEMISKKSLAMTCQLRDFKAAGAEGILDCQIKSVILPLLADHVLREANHYIRMLEAK